MRTLKEAGGTGQRDGKARTNSDADTVNVASRIVASRMRTLTRSLALAFLLAACTHTHRARQPVEWVAAPGEGHRPFSELVRVGRMLYLSGQLGTDSTGKVVSGGIQAETRQALENIKHVLETHGSSMDDVVKCTAMLADIKEWGAMNEVYVSYFPRHLPARSAFATNGLALGGRIELECMATRTETK
jgi:2-iminobutanoate/2-iminopropanoate deaminase